MRMAILLLAILVLANLGFSCLDYCMNDCCGKHGGAVMELQRGKATECDAMSTCMVLFLGSIKGQEDEACIAYTGATGFSKSSINSCMATCMNECGSTWSGSESPFTDGPSVPEPEEEPESVCDGVSCPSVCRDEGSTPTIYYDGQCIEDNSTADGYVCGYVRGQCVWQCNSAGTNCDDADPLQVTISEPYEGDVFDPGTTGYSLTDVKGTVSSSSTHTVSYVTISTNLGVSQQASYGGGSFSLSNVKLATGRPTYITATAYDSQGRRLGKKTVTVESKPKLMNLLFKKGSVTLWRNGNIVGSDWLEGFNSYDAKEGDMFEVSGSGDLTAMYSDGTTITLKGPFQVKIYSDGIHLIKGAAEIDVKRDYQVLGRWGQYLVKGTKFKVIVPESESVGESLIVLEGTVLASLFGVPEETASVGANKRVYIYPGVVPGQGTVENANSAELLSFENGGQITTPETHGDVPSGGGCCGTAFVLAALLVFVGGFKHQHQGI